MKKSHDLIEQLSSEIKPVNPISPPLIWGLRLVVILLVYGVGMQIFSGIREDVSDQFQRPLYVIEIIILLSLLLTSVFAAVLSIYPDVYQKPHYLRLPHIILLVLIIALISQLFVPNTSDMIIPNIQHPHALECTLSIAAIAFIPALLIFVIIRKGAVVHQLEAGSFAVLAASAVGCLVLRLAEANDSIGHLLIWHYLPTFAFACAGAFIGKAILKW